MQVAWQSVHDAQEGEHDLTWQYGLHTVNAALYDTGEWVIRFGANGDAPVELYSRGVFTREAAVVEAQACMRELTVEHVAPESVEDDEQAVAVGADHAETTEETEDAVDATADEEMSASDEETDADASDEAPSVDED